MLAKWFFLFAGFLVWCDPASARTRVVLYSFDGFRHDYYNRYQPTNLKFMAQSGVHATEGMISAFPTKTFPNHYTLVTGLYEESHGIVDNDMYDPLFKETFDLKNTETKWWDGGDPIWISAKRQGRKTAVGFWPGSEVKLSGTFPDLLQKYVDKLTFDQRVEKTIDWLVKDGADIVVMYFNEPDASGHKFGVFTPQVEEAVYKADQAVGKLFQRLGEVNLLDSVDVIVVADHGMVNTSNIPEKDFSKVIFLDKILDMNEIDKVPSTGPITAILPKPGKEDSVYEKLKNNEVHIKVFRKKDIPSRFHYQNHRRIMPIIVLADEGYVVLKDQSEVPVFTIGQHGYDNSLPSMRGIFFARGPSFKQNAKMKLFENVNIYSLLCHLLDVEPSPNNGTVITFKNILKNSQTSLRSAAVPLLVGFLAIIVSMLV